MKLLKRLLYFVYFFRRIPVKCDLYNLNTYTIIIAVETCNKYTCWKYFIKILGLTTSPGTNKAKDLSSAKYHLTKVMANLDVSELSVVKRNKEELLQYTSIPEKGI